jgi:hypothetical protein
MTQTATTTKPQPDDVAAMIADEIMTLPLTEAELEMIARAVKQRRSHMQSVKTIGLRKGDQFRIGGNAPQKEHGGICVVKHVNQKTVTCRSDSPAFAGTKWARSAYVRVPLTWIGEVI